MRFWVHAGLLLVWLLAAVLPGKPALAQTSSTAQRTGWSAPQADELVYSLRGWVDQQGARATREDQRQVAFAAAEAIRR